MTTSCPVFSCANPVTLPTSTATYLARPRSRLCHLGLSLFLQCRHWRVPFEYFHIQPANRIGHSTLAVSARALIQVDRSPPFSLSKLVHLSFIHISRPTSFDDRLSLRPMLQNLQAHKIFYTQRPEVNFLSSSPGVCAG